MFENTLVGVDGGSGGRDAVALASLLTDPGGSLTLAHVHAGRLRPIHAATPSMVEEERQAADILLEVERAESGVEAELARVEALSPGRGLHQRAEDQRADLIVVGSCSRGVLGRAMLGDDTRAALNGAPCAVAVAPVGFAELRAPIKRIGVAYDGTRESEAALARGRELAEATSASLHALEVVTIPTVAYGGIVAPMIGEDIQTTLDAADKRMHELPGVDGRAVYGLAGEELAAFGDEVDLLIVGSRGYGPIRRLVLGSTSDYLERRARSALLVLPRPQAAGSDELERLSGEVAAGVSSS